MSRHDRTPSAGSDRTNLYDEITDKIIAELEAGRFPWAQQLQEDAGVRGKPEINWPGGVLPSFP